MTSRRLCWIVTLVVAWLAADPGHAAEERRVALVVGANAYTATQPLKNPVNDATDLAQKLRGLGFDVTLVLDPTKAALRRSLVQFARAVNNSDVALFYYAGHALQSDGRNYLLGTDSNPTDAEDLYDETVDMFRVTEALSAANLRIVILDACRNNPLSSRLVTRNRSLLRGLAPLPPSQSEVVVFSAAAGEVAEDGDGRNSPFTAALLQRIGQPGVELGQLLIQVTRDVRRASNNRQRPSVEQTRDELFFFVPADRPDQAGAPTTAAPAEPAAAPAQTQIFVSHTDGSVAVPFPKVTSFEGVPLDPRASRAPSSPDAVPSPGSTPRTATAHPAAHRVAASSERNAETAATSPPPVAAAVPPPVDDAAVRETARKQLISGWTK